MDWLKIRKGVHQGHILEPCLFTLYAEYIMQNAKLDEAQAGIKIAGRNIRICLILIKKGQCQKDKEYAQKHLSAHNLNFKPQPPPPK